MPRDFAETFVRVGWEGVEFEMRAGKVTILRWCHEYGYDALKLMRREHLEAKYAERGHSVPGRKPRSVSGRYVMGRTRQASHGLKAAAEQK